MDHHTIKRCIEGEREAQGKIYEEYSPQMFAICLRYAPDRSVAEDVLQDAFIKVFAKIGSFKGDGELGAWIRRVVINTALEQLRKIKKAESRSVDLDFCYDLSSADDILEKMTFQEVLASIQKIPIGYREVLNLYAIDGYSHKEISEMVGISEGNSKQRLRRARNMLRKLVAEKHNGLTDEVAA